MRFLVNPAHKKRRRKKRAKASAVRARKRRTTRRATVTRNPGGNMARKKHKRTTRRRHSVGGAVRRHARRSRRSYRRNPIGGGIGNLVMQSVKDTVGIVAGEAISGSVPRLVGLNQAGIVGTAARVASGLLVAVVAKRMVGPRMAEMIAAGTVSGEARRYIKNANIPVLSSALGDDAEYDDLGFIPGSVDGTVLPGESYAGVSGYLDGYTEIEGYDEAGMGDSVYDY